MKKRTLCDCCQWFEPKNSEQKEKGYYGTIGRCGSPNVIDGQGIDIPIYVCEGFKQNPNKKPLPPQYIVDDRKWSGQFKDMDDYERGYMSALYDVTRHESIITKGARKAVLVTKIYRMMEKINRFVLARSKGVGTNVELPHSLGNRENKNDCCKNKRRIPQNSIYL